jgi:hypothetical protein
MLPHDPTTALSYSTRISRRKSAPQVQEDNFSCLAAACLHRVLQAATDLPQDPPSLQEICSALDCGSADAADAMLTELKAALKNDLASTSVSLLGGARVLYTAAGLCWGRHDMSCLMPLARSCAL